jgi:hypothetical protein
MRIQSNVVEEFREWAQRPPAITGEEAARAVLGRLGGRVARPQRPVLRPVLAAAAAVLAVVVALYGTLRGWGGAAPAPGTTAALTLSSGTQVVIDLREVKP